MQEARAKIAALAALPIVWHFIGRLQANKSREVAERFQWVHTLDRIRIARRLNDQRPYGRTAAERVRSGQPGPGNRARVGSNRTTWRIWPGNSASFPG